MRTYLDDFSRELSRVGIHGRLRERILAEAADHLAESDPGRFGDPAALARQFADELATHRSRKAAVVSLASLAGAAAVFVAAWFVAALAAGGGKGDIFSAEWVPVGVAAALGMLAFPQVSFAAGLLALLRLVRRRDERRLPAAEVALLLRRTRVALTFGALSLAAVVVYAYEYRAQFSSWFVLAVAPAAAAAIVPLGAAALLTREASAVKSSVPGEAGDVFDDFPLELPRRPWLLLAVTAGAAALAALVAGDVTNEGPRNAVAELVLVVAGFLAFGERLGLRR